MCVPILRSIGTKLTKLEHMQKSRFIWFIWRHVTQKRYVMRHGDCDTSDRYFDKEHFETNQKSMAQIVVFVFSVTLTLTFDLFYIVCHTHCAWCTGISMRSFIRIRPVILGDMPWTHTHTHTHTHTEGHSNSLTKCSTNKIPENVRPVSGNKKLPITGYVKVLLWLF